MSRSTARIPPSCTTRSPARSAAQSLTARHSQVSDSRQLATSPPSCAQGDSFATRAYSSSDAVTASTSQEPPNAAPSSHKPTNYSATRATTATPAKNSSKSSKACPSQSGSVANARARPTTPDAPARDERATAGRGGLQPELWWRSVLWDGGREVNHDEVWRRRR